MTVQLVKIELFGHALTEDVGDRPFKVRVHVKRRGVTKRYDIVVRPNAIAWLPGGSRALLQPSQQFYEDFSTDHYSVNEIAKVAARALHGLAVALPYTTNRDRGPPLQSAALV